MITLQQFINNWNNKFQERRDPTNKNQCFDLAIGYCIDVLNLPEDTFSGLLHAYQIFENPTKGTSQNFDFIKNTAYAVPKPGDIIVWGKTYGSSGHVAVVVTADVNTFTAFSQNDPVGKPCILKEYKYMSIIGWLRSISQNNNSELQKEIIDLKATNERISKELLIKDETIKAVHVDYQSKLAEQATICQTMIKNTHNSTLTEAQKSLENLKK